MPGKGVPVAVGTAGIILLWSAIQNQKITTTIQDLVKGQKPQPGPATGTAPAAKQIITTPGPATESSAAAGTPAGTPGANKALGLLMATAYGWGAGNNWLCLETGWELESGWNQYAANDPSDPYNHAYGIPQANPGTKMATAGNDWKTSPVTQIKWGLLYIRETYGSPSQVPGWTPNGPIAGYQGY